MSEGKIQVRSGKVLFVTPGGVFEREVVGHGNSARINMPKDLIGKEVVVIVVDAMEEVLQ